MKKIEIEKKKKKKESQIEAERRSERKENPESKIEKVQGSISQASKQPASLSVNQSRFAAAVPGGEEQARGQDFGKAFASNCE